MTTTAQLPDDDYPETDPERLRERLGRLVDVILDGGACGLQATTILDLTGPVPEVVRPGLGPFP
jgi:tRNA A37 threonylcarbamoyladenosine synthetase subunit TsaC/SUA5/YrdC